MVFRNASRSLLAAGAALALIAPATGHAITIPPTLMFDVVEGALPGVLVNAMGTLLPADDDGVEMWSLDAPEVIEGVTIDSWRVELKRDPFVVNNINVTNNTGAVQTFVATVLLPIPAFNYDEVINSSVGVTVTDSNNDGTLLFENDGSTTVYAGLINGSTALPLDTIPHPITIADCGFAGCTANGGNGTASFAVTPGVATDIGITLTFKLSPGDSAGLTSRFEIIPEPEPTLLMGIGLAGLAFSGRRRRAGA